MKVFITGGSGILGSALQQQLVKHDNVIRSFNSKDIELSSLTDVVNKVNNFMPDVIIHCAAMTNVDLCEDEREMAWNINVTGTKNMALAAKAINAKIVYISSCGVYGAGGSAPCTELDKTAPVNYHHLTKLEGEKAVIELTSDYLIIRPGWLFGGTTSHKKNFVEARRKEAVSSTSIKSAVDKIGSPTYTLDLANQIILLLEKNASGVFNVVNEGCSSRFDYVKKITELFKLSTTVEPSRSNEFPRRANMPDNECLLNKRLTEMQLNYMRPWQDALAEYIQTTYNL